MKLLVSCLILYVLNGHWLFGQSSTSSLSDDPTFAKTMAQSIRYPSSAHRQQLIAKVYISFSITDQGQISQINVLNLGNIDTAFIQEVKMALTGLSKQDSRFKGDYILPVTFQLESATQVYTPPDEEKELIQRWARGIILNDIVVMGYI